VLGIRGRCGVVLEGDLNLQSNDLATSRSHIHAMYLSRCMCQSFLAIPDIAGRLSRISVNLHLVYVSRVCARMSKDPPAHPDQPFIGPKPQISIPRSEPS
jgi:hypothetical protein